LGRCNAPTAGVLTSAQPRGSPEMRTSRSLARVRLLAVAAAASAALALIAATPAAAAADTKGHQQATNAVADTVMGLSGFSSASPPPARTVTHQVSTGPIQVSGITSRTRTPQATSSCTWNPTQTYTSNYSAQNELTEVEVQNSDEPSCTITMSALSEVANIVTPHTGTHNIGNAKCSNCSSLPVYGSYLCSTGLQCVPVSGKQSGRSCRSTRQGGISPAGPPDARPALSIPF